MLICYQAFVHDLQERVGWCAPEGACAPGAPKKKKRPLAKIETGPRNENDYRENENTSTLAERQRSCQKEHAIPKTSQPAPEKMRVVQWKIQCSWLLGLQTCRTVGYPSCGNDGYTSWRASAARSPSNPHPRGSKPEKQRDESKRRALGCAAAGGYTGGCAASRLRRYPHDPHRKFSRTVPGAPFPR
jgi:hypothetical protein